MDNIKEYFLKNLKLLIFMNFMVLNLIILMKKLILIIMMVIF